MTFRKLIPEYINHELDDETLNEFLKHLNVCSGCKDELEIHFVVLKGVDILDNRDGDYNISEAFKVSVEKDKKYLKIKKTVLRLLYVLDSCGFWFIFIAALIFIRLFLKW